MDSLTKSLIKDFLPESIDGKEVTAVFGGGFKPPTAGHLAVIQNALKDNPEIDNIIIYVGSKIRDGITQDQSFKIWDEYYKPLIDKPVRVEKSVSPIGDIYRYAKDNPEDSIYWIIGAREGREDDLQDISSRSVSIDKYPNLNLKVTSTPDGGMSGTNARQALVNNDKENFNFFIPSNANQDEIWNILTSQPLNEGDPKKGTGKKPKGSKRRLYTDENPKDTVKVKFSTRQDIIDTLNKTSFKSKSHARQSQVINLIHQRVRAALSRTKDPQKKAKLRSAFEYIKKRKEASKKKTQRLKKQKTNEAIDTNFDKVKFYHNYYTNVSPSTFEIILEENDIRISNIIEPYPSNFGPKDVRQIPVNPNLEENIDPKVQAKHKGKSAPFGSAYEPVKEGDTYEKMAAKGKKAGSLKQGTVRSRLKIPKDKKIPLSLINKELARLRKMDKDGKKKGVQLGDKNQKYYKALQLAKTLKTTTNVNETGLEIAKKNMDDYKKTNRLNENTTYSNYIDYKQEIKDLTKHMLKKGMNITPLPKVIFKHNNEENAKDFLGKTAYYNPNSKVVVLYTEGRHPKDVVRSYAHEMIHHIQNLEGRLKDISTTNTMEDDYLNDIEREAYTRGNMIFRNYTDGKDGEEVTSLNEKEKPYKHKYGFDKNLGKDPFGLNQFARELATLEEGRYDTLSNQISRDIFNFWKEDFDEGEKDSTYEDNYDFPPRGIQVYAQIIYKPKFGKLKVDGGSDYAYIDKETKKKYPGFIKVTFIVDPKMLPEFWEEISMNLKDVVRHEIEHITQSGDSKTKREDFDEDFDIAIRALVKADIIPQAEYFKLPKEVDANLQGMYFRAKKERRPLIDVINTYLDAQDITPKDKQIILDLWRSRRKALSLPKF